VAALARVALISSPRSGNTWMRYLLRDACGLTELAHNNPWDVDWDALPERCILQMHCHRTPELVDRLRRLGFARLHMSRHPLDVLLSILQVCEAVPETAEWVAREGGDESAIAGRSPQDPAFLEYATGARARALLAITPEWWDDGDPSVLLRYEDLVEDPHGRLAAVIDGLGLAPVAPLGATVEANRIDRLRFWSEAFFWRGSPGLWRRLLTASQAEAIRDAVAPEFWTRLYRFDPDPALTPDAADAAWKAALAPA
jgi:hypothetical protein